MSVETYPIKLPCNYSSRDYQEEFWQKMQKEGKKRGVLVWHRRAGKEKTCWNYLIQKACSKVGLYYYLFPEFAQGRKILWDGVDKNGFRFLDHIPKPLIAGYPNSTEMKVKLLNGSLIQVIGTNNINSIVGTNPVGCVFSEYSLQNPVGWQLIRPILTENGGWAIFNGTPRGANHFKDLYDMASNNPDWFCQLLTVEDTNAISLEDIQAEREAGMSEDFIQQEFYCSFTLGVEGSYYAKYVQEARTDNRVGSVPVDVHTKVHTAWDIGYGDSTSIVFFQIVGNEIHIVDFYENQGEGLAHYIEIISGKKYLYGSHYAPHDIESHDFSSGLSAQEIGASLGIRFITLPTLKISVAEGIEAVRSLFPRMWIHEVRCKHLLKCLENYRKEFDEKMEVYRNRPRHDKYSHCADAIRYMALAIKIHVDSEKSGIDDEKADDMWRKNNPVFK